MQRSHQQADRIFGRWAYWGVSLFQGPLAPSVDVLTLVGIYLVLKYLPEPCSSSYCAASASSACPTVRASSRSSRGLTAPAISASSCASSSVRCSGTHGADAGSGPHRHVPRPDSRPAQLLVPLVYGRLPKRHYLHHCCESRQRCRDASHARRSPLRPGPTLTMRLRCVFGPASLGSRARRTLPTGSMLARSSRRRSPAATTLPPRSTAS